MSWSLMLLGFTALLHGGIRESASPFPEASPEQVGMSSERLDAVVRTVKDWVDSDRIVGAVMLVVRDGKLVLHDAVGWSDKENGVPMRVDTICRMRSMTKPLVGTAVLMLMEEGRLALDDPVSHYLPSFDNPKSKEITVFQLLTHTSGLTGAIYDQEGTSYRSLREAVDDVGRMGPSFPPGTDYHYSDPGSSTLGALVAEIAGVPAEEFIQKRILDPLEMRDSLPNLRIDDPRASRVGATYAGESGKWERYWDNSQPQVLPFFRASGGLYSTAMDYARFMAVMLDGGRWKDARLLSRTTVKLATQPHSSYVYRQDALRQRDAFYGLHWQVYSSKYSPLKRPVSDGSYGHGGSDGTFAWVDPAERLLGVYLTQSRGNGTSRLFVNMVQAAIIE